VLKARFRQRWNSSFEDGTTEAAYVATRDVHLLSFKAFTLFSGVLLLGYLATSMPDAVNQLQGTYLSMSVVTVIVVSFLCIASGTIFVYSLSHKILKTCSGEAVEILLASMVVLCFTTFAIQWIVTETELYTEITMAPENPYQLPWKNYTGDPMLKHKFRQHIGLNLKWGFSMRTSMTNICFMFIIMLRLSPIMTTLTATANAIIHTAVLIASPWPMECVLRLYFYICMIALGTSFCSFWFDYQCRHIWAGSQITTIVLQRSFEESNKRMLAEGTKAENDRLELLAERTFVELQINRDEKDLLEEKIRGSELLRTASSKLTQAELERAKLEAACVVSGDLHMWAQGEESARHANNTFHVRQVQRDAKVASAWPDGEQQWHHATGEQDIGNGPKLPCLATSSEDGRTFTANLLRATGLGKEMVIKPGSHAFVVVKGEPYTRVGTMAHPFGEASGHPQLASEKQVLFAGEVEFNSQQEVTRWNNLSGTYKCEEFMAFQAGLPMDKFYAVRPEEPSGEARHVAVHIQSGNVWLQKVLEFGEAELIEVHNEWVGHIKTLMERDPKVKECFSRMQHMTVQICHAIEQYGLYSYV